MRPHISVRGLLCPSHQLMHARGQFVRALWELFSASRRLGGLLHGPSLCKPGLAHNTERPYSPRIGWSRNAMRLRHFKDIRLNQKLRSRVSAVVVRSNGKTPRREDAEFRGGRPGFHLTRESRQARAANAAAHFCTRLALSVSSTRARPQAVCSCALRAFLGVSASRRFASWAIALRTRPRAHRRAALFASHCARTRALARAWLSRLVYLASLAYLAVNAGAVSVFAVWARPRPVHRARLAENALRLPGSPPLVAMPGCISDLARATY